VGYALEIASPDLPTKLFWAKIEYLGIIVIPLAWLIFSAQYSGNTGWLEHSTGRQILLWVVPVLTLCLVWTNEAHHLVWRQVGLRSMGDFSILSIEHGPWFWVLIGFSYSLLLAGSIWLAAKMARSRPVERRMIGFVLAGIFIPWIANLLYLADLNPIPYLDWTPFAFILAGVMFSLSLFRFHLLNILPIAQKTVFDGLADAILVLDIHDKIIDLNPAAQTMLGKVEGLPNG
jgi:PAS domain-containing protein